MVKASRSRPAAKELAPHKTQRTQKNFRLAANLMIVSMRTKRYETKHSYHGTKSKIVSGHEVKDRIGASIRARSQRSYRGTKPNIRIGTRNQTFVSGHESKIVS